MTPLTKRPRTLPHELMYKVLDYLELYDLFALLATSRDWRQVTLDHPTFWRCPQLLSTSDSAIDLFLARLCQARKREIYVRVDALQVCRRISDEVLPAVASCFNHLADFGAAVHHDQVSYLFAALRRPAPVLKRFQIFVIRLEKAPLSVLPTDVFCGSAPMLIFVGLRDIAVSNAVYPAFCKVVNVDFGFTRADVFYAVPQVFPVFPRIRRFGLDSGDVTVPEDFELPCNLPSDLDTIECVMNADTVDVMISMLPYHAIPTVRVAGLADDTVDFFTGHLPGGLALEVRDRRNEFPELFDLALTSTETDFTRIFGQSARRYLANVTPPIPFLRDHDFAERLVALTIPNVLWGFLARHFLPFPNLKTLTVRLDSPTVPVLGRKWSVSCERLQTLRLAANTVDPLYMSTERLAAFLATSLADRPAGERPALELDAVILEGDCTLLEPHLRLSGEAASPSLSSNPSRAL